MAVQFVTKMNAAEKIIVVSMIISNVFCLLSASDMVPLVNDPKTLPMVKTVVINPICVTVRLRFRFIKRGAAKVIIPLFTEIIGNNKARDSVFFFLNSLVTIRVSFFCLC